MNVDELEHDLFEQGLKIETRLVAVDIRIAIQSQDGTNILVFELDGAFRPSYQLSKDAPVKKRDEQDDASDADAFARAMAKENVVRLPPDSRGRVRAASPVSLPPATTATPPSDDSGQSDEAFAAPGVDRREIRKLKRGEYVAADRRDLHGMTAAAACASVKQFLESSRHNRHRCICIVHGRGLRSPGGVAVLKARVREYLRSHRAVLAFADAPRSDGGAGAVYVLLRR